MKVLIVDDDRKTASFIRKGLTDLTYAVTIADDGLAGYRLASEGHFDIVILDNMLPDISGLEVCSQIREKNGNLPILILSAHDSVKDRVSGLERGADDFMGKPFHFDELVARLKAISRRREPVSQEAVLSVDDLEFDLIRRKVTREGQNINLSAKELKLLEVLLTNKNKVLSREFLSLSVWGVKFDGTTNFVDVYVSYLRSKIDKGHPTRIIETVVGLGYTIRE